MRGNGEARQHQNGGRGPGRSARVVQGPRGRDWVFEAEDAFAIDLQGISLLLTARQMASADHRRVWLAGLPPEFWGLMASMGLEGYFLPFPDHGSIEA